MWVVWKHKKVNPIFVTDLITLAKLTQGLFCRVLAVLVCLGVLVFGGFLGVFWFVFFLPLPLETDSL